MALLSAEVQTLVLVSIYKPILVFLFFAGWGWIVTKLDKDAAQLSLQRTLWNLVQIGSGATALGLWLLIPMFWVGLPVALILAVGGMLGYVAYRNSKVKPEAKWVLNAQTFESLLKPRGSSSQAKRELTTLILNPDTSKRPLAQPDTPEYDSHLVLQDLLEYAFPRKGDRVELIVAGSEKAVAAIGVDGVNIPQKSITPPQVLGLIKFVKAQAGLDVDDLRKLQSGTLLVSSPGAEGKPARHTLSVTTQGSTRDVRMTIRIDPDLRSSVGIAKLGLLEGQRQQLETVLKAGDRKGIVLVTSKAGQGQTTTLYSILHEHDPYLQSLVTLEEEVAFEVEGVHHNTIPMGSDAAAVNNQLAQLIRGDPQVLMVGQLADAQTAKILARASREMRVYLGINQDDTFAALSLWIKALGDPRTAAENLRAVIGQKLVRRLCRVCRSPYKPDPDAMRKLNLPPDRVKELFKPSGKVMVNNKEQVCPNCMGMAYQGRIGVFEVMIFDDQARALVSAGQLEPLKAHLRKNKMLYMQESALARVVDGTTSIQEITRVMAGKEK